MGLNFGLPRDYYTLMGSVELQHHVYYMSAQTNRLAYLLDTVTYKPGWKLQAMDGPQSPLSPSTVLAITFRANDPVTGASGEFGRYITVPESLLLLDNQALLKWIEHLIIEMEIHEVHEFLRVDGVPLTNPHPKAK